MSAARLSAEHAEDLAATADPADRFVFYFCVFSCAEGVLHDWEQRLVMTSFLPDGTRPSSIETEDLLGMEYGLKSPM